jgi:hypothetical protein
LAANLAPKPWGRGNTSGKVAGGGRKPPKKNVGCMPATSKNPEESSMKITFVKKILMDGSPCGKCADVIEKLESSGQMSRINETLIADERNPESPGMLVAKRYQVDRAPFFLVESANESPRIYTVYLKFVKEVLEQRTDENEELKEILRNNSDLDFL